MTLLLREADVRQLLTMEDAIGLMEDALRAFSTGGVVQPVRTAVPVQPHAGFLALMPAYLTSKEALGSKAVTFFPKNADRSLPTHMAIILLWDHATGELLAMMDGRLITEMRTAATSAAATKALARPEAATLGVLGAGVQARSHLEALRLVRPLERVRIWSRTATRARTFADQMAKRHRIPVKAVATPEEVVRDAQIIVTVTSSQTPVLKGEWVAPGTHINAVGAPRPDWREMDSALVRRASLFVDSRAGALVESGDLLLAIGEGAITEAHIRGEIGEVLAGRVAGRRTPEEITLFKSLGMAVEDVATARWVYERAQARGLGQHIEMD
ncbi:MAG TPA: ornithine cyclodeaminase family protein [bacterium]|nr:ornithine cyclodeaminase family protein [bacterium]